MIIKRKKRILKPYFQHQHLYKNKHKQQHLQQAQIIENTK